VVIVLLPSLKVSVNQREQMGINGTLWAVENVWYNSSLLQTLAVVPEANTLVHKLLL